MTAKNIFYNFVGFRLVLGIVPPRRIFIEIDKKIVILVKQLFFSTN